MKSKKTRQPLQETRAVTRTVKKLTAYERHRLIQNVLDAVHEFSSLNQLVEWAKNPGRRDVSETGLARMESARDALGRRALRMVASMPDDMFRRKGAKKS